jgi:S-formylglutathione hydrolase
MALLTPDTSPRHARFNGDDASWDLGVGAGFYLDATVTPWSRASQMGRRLLDELLPFVANARRHPGFDHGSFFFQSVVADHLRHHADAFGLDRDEK